MKLRDRIVGLRRIKGRDLIPHPANWRTHPPEQRAALEAALREIGIADALLGIETKRGVMLVDGHLRHDAAPDSEWPVLILDLSEKEAKKLLLTLDPLAGLAGTDQDKLRGLLDGVKFDNAVLAELAAGLAEPAMPIGGPDVPQDNVPDRPTEAKTKPGDLYRLGNHRLLCGDATNEDDVCRLLDGEAAALLLTDPPYNVGYVGKTADALEIDNDQMDETAYRDFLIRSLRPAFEALLPGAVWYVWHADSHGLTVRQAVADCGQDVRQCLVWVKQSMVLCRQDYHWRHEPCLCGQTEPDGTHSPKQHESALYGWNAGAAHAWLNDRCQTTVLEYARPSRSEEHPTMKPLPLWAYLVGNSCPAGKLIYDPFGGSGTTVMAAEGTGRRAAVLEIDPIYCDVIVTRWEQQTGRKAKLTAGTAVKRTKARR